MSSAGIAAVTQGMAAAEFITGKLGINLSNANTPGYKGFGTYLLSETSKYNGGVNAGSRINANIQGEISETKNEFDYAIEDDVFFALKCGEQTKYTRAGRYELDNQDFIKSPNGCYLLGEAYTDDNQDQVTDIEKANLKPIKLDKNPIKGQATTTADISLSLSAKQMVMGGGNGDLIVQSLSDNDKFKMYFYETKGDSQPQTSEYNFVYRVLDTSTAEKTKETKAKFDPITNTIIFNDKTTLIDQVNNNLGHFINLKAQVTGNKIDFEVQSSSGNNVLAKFDSTPQILGKLNLGSYLSAGYVKPNYDAGDAALNMAGGKIRADAKTEFNVIDSLGNDHEIFVAFKKIATMKYAVEVYTAKGDVNNGRDDGLIAAGTIKFDSKGKGEIEAASTISGVKGLEDELEFRWADEGESLAGPNNIQINWNKLQMYDDNQLINIDSDGKKGGTLQSTSVDDKGNLTGHYTNGDQKKLAAIPVAIFKDPLKLENEFGTIFSDTAESGKPSFRVANLNGAGKIVSGNLEGANVDETKSMTDLMKQQRFYSYNAKSYGMMNNMEDVLLGVIRV